MSNHKSVVIPIILGEGAEVPAYASDLAAGADVRACIKESIVIEPGDSALIPTGLKVAIPEGYEIQVRPRSGLAFKNKITVLNTPGTVDADYRGDVGIILINHGRDAFTVTPGMRIAQFVLAEVVQAHFILEAALTATSRGEGGLGSTGLL